MILLTVWSPWAGFAIKELEGANTLLVLQGSSLRSVGVLAVAVAAVGRAVVSTATGWVGTLNSRVPAFFGGPFGEPTLFRCNCHG